MNIFLYGFIGLLTALGLAYYRARWTDHFMSDGDEPLEIGLLGLTLVAWPAILSIALLVIPFKRIYTKTTPQYERDRKREAEQLDKERDLQLLEQQLRDFASKHDLPWVNTRSD